MYSTHVWLCFAIGPNRGVQLTQAYGGGGGGAKGGVPRPSGGGSKIPIWAFFPFYRVLNQDFTTMIDLDNFGKNLVYFRYH